MSEETPKTVYIDNYDRAQTDYNLAEKIRSTDAFGKMYYEETIAQIENREHFQIVAQNRDTLYSYGVFDLTSPVRVELPANSVRYLSMQTIDQDQYTLDVTIPDTTKKTIITFKYQQNLDINEKNNSFIEKNIKSVTRYVFIILRTLADPKNRADLEKAQALQKSVILKQDNIGKFEVPNWDSVSMSKVMSAIGALAQFINQPCTPVLGKRGEIGETAHLIGTAVGWGGLPSQYATYRKLFPLNSDVNSTTVYKISIKDVPIRPCGFWSITVYNSTGYLEYNKNDSYSHNSLTAKPEDDGTYVIYFSESKADYMANWVYIYSGWHYIVRMYEPGEEILEDKWQFPSLENV